MITYVLPLALGATPPALRGQVFDGLLKYIKEHNNTWWGGIINNRFLFDVLHDNGRPDVALAMLQKREYPSYGYMYFNNLEPARECMWELPDAPFEGTGMNSRNHHMYSSVGKYLLERIAGLEMLPDGELAVVAGSFEGHANVTIESIRGTATVTWAALGLGAHVTARVIVPVGMLAHVHISADSGDVFLIEWGPLLPERSLPRGVLSVESTKRAGRNFHRITVQSGEYEFSTNAALVV